MPTLAEKWYEQGVEQGERLGVVRTLLDQLTYRFGPLDPLLEERIRTLPMPQIHALSLFTLDATSIDQVVEQVRRLQNE